MTDPYLTVSDLAEACAPVDAAGDFDNERFRLWTRRLRHWTTLDILPTAAKHSEGSGQHRLYEANLAYIASVLLRMAAAGAPLPVIKEVSEILQTSTKGRGGFARSWRNAVATCDDGDSLYCLVISIAEEGKSIDVSLTGAGRPSVATFRDRDYPAEPMIFLNLSAIFGLVKIQLS